MKGKTKLSNTAIIKLKLKIIQLLWDNNMLKHRLNELVMSVRHYLVMGNNQKEVEQEIEKSVRLMNELET